MWILPVAHGFQVDIVEYQTRQVYPSRNSGEVTSTYNATTVVGQPAAAAPTFNTFMPELLSHPALNFNGNFTIATSVRGRPWHHGSPAANRVMGQSVKDRQNGEAHVTQAELYEDTALKIDLVVSDVGRPR